MTGSRWPGHPGEVLAYLRALIPNRRVDYPAALRVAEDQAAGLLAWSATDVAPVFSTVITKLPHIRVRTQLHLPISGATLWDGQQWVITLNGSEPWTRRRLTLGHEFKHVIDHGHQPQLYTDTSELSTHEQAERAADYFAGCLLMPADLITRAWTDGDRQPSALARMFAVSERAMHVRLHQLDLPTTSAGQPITRSVRNPAWITHDHVERKSA